MDPNTLQNTSIACNTNGVTRDNSYWRLFDPDATLEFFNIEIAGLLRRRESI